MFVEKLDEQDIKDFTRAINCKYIRHSSSNKRSIDLVVFVGLYTPNITFTLTDFGCKTPYNLGESSVYVQNVWRNFLSQKFKDYKKALKEYTRCK